MTKTQELINKTEKRKKAFEIMINHISKKTNPLIIETGCARQEGNFGGDGQSTLIFDQYIQDNGGELYSVDINERNVSVAKRLTKKANVICSDSVKFLYEMNAKLKKENRVIDLLYLDSYDYHEGIKHQSSLHHIKELIAIWPSCSSETIIAIDDNFEDGSGKGKYAKEYFKDIGIEPLYNGYQILWQVK